MDTAKQAEIQAHARAIAALLYEEADVEQVQTLASIEDQVVYLPQSVALSPPRVP